MAQDGLKRKASRSRTQSPQRERGPLPDVPCEAPARKQEVTPVAEEGSSMSSLAGDWEGTVPSDEDRGAMPHRRSKSTPPSVRSPAKQQGFHGVKLRPLKEAPITSGSLTSDELPQGSGLLRRETLGKLSNMLPLEGGSGSSGAGGAGGGGGGGGSDHPLSSLGTLPTHPAPLRPLEGTSTHSLVPSQVELHGSGGVLNRHTTTKKLPKLNQEG